MGHETAEYVLSLWEDSYRDVTKFKLQLENWFDRTMEQTTEWYKRKIQFILLLIGFFLAWFFNADTFAIVKKLSIDKKAREEMVQLATAYIENNRYTKDTGRAAATADYNAKLDTLLSIKKNLDTDISKANALLGTSGWPSAIFRVDTTIVYNYTTQNKTVHLKRTYWAPGMDTTLLPQSNRLVVQDTAYIKVLDGNQKQVAFISKYYTIHSIKFWGRCCYFLNLGWVNFWGFAITAIAVSLGAPFWFDMLNKLMQLRTSMKQQSTATNNSTPGNTTIPQPNREA
jgi:hypothetical protein